MKNFYAMALSVMLAGCVMDDNKGVIGGLIGMGVGFTVTRMIVPSNMVALGAGVAGGIAGYGISRGFDMTTKDGIKGAAKGAKDTAMAAAAGAADGIAKMKSDKK